MVKGAVVSQQTEPVQVSPLDLKAAHELALLCDRKFHSLTFEEGAAQVLAAHRVAAERAALAKAIEICCEYGCEAADELVTRIEQLTAPAAQSVKGFTGDPRDSE